MVLWALFFSQGCGPHVGIRRQEKRREEEKEDGERKDAMRPDGSKARDQEQWSSGTG